MTKQGVKGKYQRTPNEKYEIYLNNENNKYTYKIKSTNCNKVQVIYYHLDLCGTISLL